MTGPESPVPESSPPELSFRVSLVQIGTLGTAREVIASADECAAIAARLLIPAVAALSCRFQLVPAQNGVVVARGSLAARVTQICVVTLEPFDADLREDFRIRFIPADQMSDPKDDLLELDADDEVPYQGSQIDLGEASVEQLALALDPYPRAPGAELPATGPDGADGAAPASPFAAPASPLASPFAAIARRARPS